MRVATYQVEVLGKEKTLTLGIGLINKLVTVYPVIEIFLILEIPRKLLVKIMVKRTPRNSVNLCNNMDLKICPLLGKT